MEPSPCVAMNETGVKNYLGRGGNPNEYVSLCWQFLHGYHQAVATFGPFSIIVIPLVLPCQLAGFILCPCILNSKMHILAVLLSESKFSVPSLAGARLLIEAGADVSMPSIRSCCIDSRPLAIVYAAELQKVNLLGNMVAAGAPSFPVMERSSSDDYDTIKLPKHEQERVRAHFLARDKMAEHTDEERARNKQEYHEELSKWMAKRHEMGTQAKLKLPTPKCKMPVVLLWLAVVGAAYLKDEKLITNWKFDFMLSLVSMASAGIILIPAGALKKLKCIDTNVKIDLDSKRQVFESIPRNRKILFVSHRWVNGYPDPDGEILRYLQDHVGDDVLVWIDACCLEFTAVDTMSAMLLFVQLKTLRESKNVQFYRPNSNYEQYSHSAWCQTEELLFCDVSHVDHVIENAFEIYDFILMAILIKWASEVGIVTKVNASKHLERLSKFITVRENDPPPDWWNSCEIPPLIE